MRDATEKTQRLPMKTPDLICKQSARTKLSNVLRRPTPIRPALDCMNKVALAAIELGQKI